MPNTLYSEYVASILYSLFIFFVFFGRLWPFQCWVLFLIECRKNGFGSSCFWGSLDFFARIQLLFLDNFSSFFGSFSLFLDDFPAIFERFLDFLWQFADAIFDVFWLYLTNSGYFWGFQRFFSIICDFFFTILTFFGPIFKVFINHFWRFLRLFYTFFRLFMAFLSIFDLLRLDLYLTSIKSDCVLELPSIKSDLN